jgi:hypothetical protein
MSSGRVHLLLLRAGKINNIALPYIVVSMRARILRWTRGRPAGNIAVVSMCYHGNATRYLAMGVCRSLMIPALDRHIRILLLQIIFGRHLVTSVLILNVLDVVFFKAIASFDSSQL